MKTKIVYVLTSSEQDFYLEQTLMSVYSARRHNPDATIIFVTDTQTVESCREGMRRDFLSLFNEVKVIDIPEYPKPKERSRYLKTTLRETIEGDLLYIDGDTIVCEPLDSIDEQAGLLCCVIDRHIAKEHWSLFFREESRIRGFGTAEVDKHFNCGVSFVRDSPETHEFYKLWHEEWRTAVKNGNSQDQPPFHTTMARLGFQVTELEGIWNCMLCGCFLPYLHRAKILHTFATATYEDVPSLFREQSLYEEIRANSGLTERAKHLIENPKEAFAPVCLAMGQQNIATLRSPLVVRSGYMYKHYRPLYNILDNTANLLRRLCDLINRFRVAH